MSSVLYMDFETRSRADLKKVSAVRYARDPSTSVLCMPWAIDDGDVDLWTPDQGPPARDLLDAMEDPSVAVVAHNSFFDRHVHAAKLAGRAGWPALPLDRWHDTLAIAAYRALPLSLDKLGQALNVPIKKDAEGHRHMLKVTKPRRPRKAFPDEVRWWDSPEDMERLYQYARRDIPPMRSIFKLLGPLPERERRIWLLDQRRNDRGIRVDVDTIQAGVRLLDEDLAIRKARVPNITDGAVKSADCIKAILVWLTHFDIYLPNLQADTVDELLLTRGPTLPKEVKELLDTRRVTSQRSVSKLHSAAAMAGEDGRVRGLYQYHGAFTGRVTGRGMQPTNIPRGQKGTEWQEEFYADVRGLERKPFEAKWGEVRPAISQRMRGLLTAEPGSKLVAADFSGIELRTLLWLADDREGLEKLRGGADLYVDLASIIFGEPVDASKDPEKRQCGKIGVLGCGYQMGANKLYISGLSQGADPTLWTPEMAAETVAAYRSRYTKVVDLWKDAENAFWQALLNPGKVYAIAGGRIKYQRRGSVMRCILPNGKAIRYTDPRALKRYAAFQLDEDGNPKPGEQKRATLTYLTAKGGAWVRKELYGGKLVEQLNQGTAREVQEDAKLRVDAAYPDSIVMDTYDEIVCEVPDSEDFTYETLAAMMTDSGRWLEGCPIAVEGGENHRYWK